MVPDSTPSPAADRPTRVVVVLGPTATGKTRLGVALARRFGGEIVGADSRQVYRGLDIGSGKDLAEYGPPGDRVPLHLVDVADPAAEYHLFRYLHDARQAVAGITARGRLPVVVGGSTLYIKALLDGYELEGGAPDPDLRRDLESQPAAVLVERLRTEAPDLFARTDLTQRRRVVRALEIARSREPGAARGPGAAAVLPALLLGPYYARHMVHERLTRRLDERLAAGLVEEVARLHDQGLSWERLEHFGLEYRDVARHLQGQLTAPQMRDTLLAHIRQLCKHQDIWFRKIEREGRPIHWLPGGRLEDAIPLVQAFLDDRPLPPPILRLDDVRYGPRSRPRGRSVTGGGRAPDGSAGALPASGSHLAAGLGEASAEPDR